MQGPQVICIASDAQQLDELSREIDSIGSVVLFDSIQSAEAKIVQFDSDSILIIQMDLDNSFSFIDKYNYKFQWIGLCKEQKFPELFTKLNEWQIQNILPMPWQKNVIRERLQLLIAQNKEQKSIHKDGGNTDEIKLKKALIVARQQCEEQQAEIEQLSSMLEENLLKAESVQEEIVPLMSALINLRVHEPLDVAILPAKLGMRLAKKLKVDIKKRKEIYKAGLLYNIGMIAMPDEILNKRFCELTEEQRDQFNAMVFRGQAMLDAVPTFEEIALTVRHLYERYDGTGFPDGLSGKAIPYYSRILVPAIDYYELQKGTYFKKKHNATEALVFILDRSGTRYDPKVVEHLSECLAEIDSNLNRVIEHIPLNRAKPGMELASSIHIKDNMMLLRAGKKFNEEMIDKLLVVQDDIKVKIMINVYRDSMQEQKAA